MSRGGRGQRTHPFCFGIIFGGQFLHGHVRACLVSVAVVAAAAFISVIVVAVVAVR